MCKLSNIYIKKIAIYKLVNVNVNRYIYGMKKLSLAHNFFISLLFLLVIQSCDEIPEDPNLIVHDDLSYGIVTSNNREWLDRNLGATKVATNSSDVEAIGDLYQWGRMTDGHEKRNSGTTNVLSSTDVPGNGFGQGFYIVPSAQPYDWRNPQNDNLWQVGSGRNNPCPQGWRIPTEEEWEIERMSWSSNDAAGAFNSPLKLVLAGGREYDGNKIYGVGLYGFYWSSTVNAYWARYLNFGNNWAAMYDHYRSGGLCVRCIKDQ